MAKSNARKYRERMIKEGRLDPTAMRGSWGLVKPATRVKDNKKRSFVVCDYDRAFNPLSVVS